MHRQGVLGREERVLTGLGASSALLWLYLISFNSQENWDYVFFTGEGAKFRKVK